MEALGIVVTAGIGIVVLIALSSILRGWVLSIVWGWFMVPFGAPALSIPTAIGVALVISFLTHQYNDNNADKDKSPGERITAAVLHAILSPFIVLLFGWAVKQFL